MFKRTMLWALCLLVIFATLGEAQRPPTRTRPAPRDSSNLYPAGTRVGRLPRVVLGDTLRAMILQATKFETTTGVPITAGTGLVSWDGTWDPTVTTYQVSSETRVVHYPGSQYGGLTNPYSATNDRWTLTNGSGANEQGHIYFDVAPIPLQFFSFVVDVEQSVHNYGMTLFFGVGSPNIPVLPLGAGGYGADGGFAIYISRPSGSTNQLHIFFAYSGDTNPVAGTFIEVFNGATQNTAARSGIYSGLSVASSRLVSVPTVSTRNIIRVTRDRKKVHVHVDDVHCATWTLTDAQDAGTKGTRFLIAGDQNVNANKRTYLYNVSIEPGIANPRLDDRELPNINATGDYILETDEGAKQWEEKYHYAPSSEPPVVCNTSNEGKSYVDLDDGRLRSCRNGVWIFAGLPTGTDVADATAANILINTEAITIAGTRITGTMPNRGSPTITPSASSQSLSSGYYSGGTISGDSDLTASNILSGVVIFGVTGAVVAVPVGTVTQDAVPCDVLYNREYSNFSGNRQTGTLVNFTNTPVRYSITSATPQDDCVGGTLIPVSSPTSHYNLNSDPTLFLSNNAPLDINANCVERFYNSIGNNVGFRLYKDATLSTRGGTQAAAWTVSVISDPEAVCIDN